MILLFFVTLSLAQQTVEKSLRSENDKMVVEFGQIDHIRLNNSEGSDQFVVRAEGNGHRPGVDLSEANGYVVLRDIQVITETSVFEQDKVCSIEPVYPSYNLYIPEGTDLYIIFDEGNLYSSGFKSSVEIKAETGIIKLQKVKAPVKIKLNAGSIFLDQLKNSLLDAETNLGVIENHIDGHKEDIHQKKLKLKVGDPVNSVLIRAVMANIYLNGSKG